MAQTFFPITPVEVTPGVANSWQAVDASTYGVPVGATGVILHCVNSTSSSDALGLRKNGSTDDRIAGLYYYAHNWAVVGVDANRIFEAYVGSTTNIDIFLIGYTIPGVTFFTNACDKSLPGVGAWANIDCSVEAPGAIGLIFEIQGGNSAMGLRQKGSTDNRISTTRFHNTFSVIIGCDGSQICEGYIGNINVDFYLVGYITDGATFNTNATDVSLGSTDVWLDLPALPSGAVAEFVEVTSGFAARGCGLRKKGSSENIYKNSYSHPWAFVECDENGVIQGKIKDTDTDFFVVGYATGPAYKNITTRFKLNVQAYKDIATRFNLWVAKDIATRFKLTVQNYQDIATHFKLTVQNYQDIVTRFNLGVATDIATRFSLGVATDIATRFNLWVAKDIATRFKLIVQSYRDIATRFKLTVQAYQDIATRFKLIVQGFKDITTRFKLHVFSGKDVSTRFFLYQPTWKSLQILEDLAELEAKIAGLKRRPKAHFEI